MNLKQLYRMRAPASGREAIAAAEPGQIDLDRETGEEMYPVAMVLPRPLRLLPAAQPREPPRLPPLRPADRAGRQRLPPLRPAPVRAQRRSSATKPAAERRTSQPRRSFVVDPVAHAGEHQEEDRSLRLPGRAAVIARTTTAEQTAPTFISLVTKHFIAERLLDNYQERVESGASPETAAAHSVDARPSPRSSDTGALGKSGRSRWRPEDGVRPTGKHRADGRERYVARRTTDDRR